MKQTQNYNFQVGGHCNITQYYLNYNFLSEKLKNNLN